MSPELKDEALEQLELDVRFGFENEEEIFERLSEMFEGEEDFDSDWLEQTISKRYRQHQQESNSWTKPTDFDKLAAAFDELIASGIVCLHKAGYTRQDGESDCMDVVDELKDMGIQVQGYCYYHEQDLARAVDPDTRNLMLGFDSPTRDNTEALQVANQIADTLRKNGFDVEWPGTVDLRIEIKNIQWQKVPDDQDWGAGRVIELLGGSQKPNKPFWKFW